MIFRPPHHPRLALVGWVLAGWAVLLLLALFELFPSYPRTVRGWVVLVLLGPLCSGAAVWVGELLADPSLGARISPKPFSWTRILVGVLVALVFLAGAAAVAWLSGEWTWDSA